MDYRDFSGGSSAKAATVDQRWWKAQSRNAMAQAITGVISFLQQHQLARQERLLRGARLYGNLSLLAGVNGIGYAKVAQMQSATRDRITYNVCQSAVDTVVAKIAKNKPKPLFLTSGGDYKLQRRAKKLNQFVDGSFYENESYKRGVSIFRDGMVLEDGFTHVFKLNGRVKEERVISSELLADEVDGFYGTPRTLHRIKNIDRQVLLEMFPDSRSLIRDAGKTVSDAMGGYEHSADVVTVRESWHLQSGPDASDGKRVLSLENGTLGVDDWEHDYFPFAHFQWAPPLWGFYGQSAVSQIQSIQLEINKLLWVVQRSMHLAGTFKIWLKNGSKVSKEHLNNEIGSIITGEEAPQYLLPPIVQPEIYQHLQTLKNAAFEQLGVSQLSAAAKKPEGLDSGKALREYNDIESDRFMVVGQNYERYYLDLAKLHIATAKEISEEDGGYAVKVPSKRFVETIDWKDIDLTEDEYVMKCYPVSSLPNDPAGRLQTIQEYVQAGFISPRTARRLLDFPDLDQAEDLASAPEDWIHECLEKIIEDGEYTAIEPYDDMSSARELALDYYAQSKCNKVEEDKLDMIRRFIDQIGLVQGIGSQPPPGMAPQAAPMPTPTSDMVPNVPGQMGGAPGPQ